MKLAVFFLADSNYHVAGWRGPTAYIDAGSNFQRWLEFAGTLERGLLDMLFIADTIGVPGADEPERLRFASKADKFEPFTLLAALSMATKNIGLVATAATTFNPPYSVARVLASLDHLSGGRAGWNLVTGGNKEDALNYNLEGHVPHDERYDQAEEYIDVVRGLWDSFAEDAFPRDKASGIYLDPHRMKVLDHRGQYFRVKGPLSMSRPPQGHPVVVQAGMSEPARRLSARAADVVFTAQSSKDDAQAFYFDLKSRTESFGRKRDDLKIMPGVVMYIGRTSREAEEKYQALQELIPIEVAVARLEQMLGGVSLTQYELDGPLPDLESNASRVSTPLNYVRIARRENLTIRQLALRSAAAKDHWTLKGTPSEIVDALEAWFVGYAADGFNVLPPDVPGTLNDLVDLIVPELQERGLFRTAYEGSTLRDNLGLPWPSG